MSRDLGTSPEIEQLRAKASREWLALPGVQSVLLSPDGSGGWKFVVYVSNSTSPSPAIPSCIQGLPVEIVPLDGPIRPLGGL
ncbi:hypothetical protein HB780_00600 (plasmid) [Rhizobium lusitanum]|uniref:hypothetical protein n=1 Tax=Rhizobium lusitanum TaxID=293958 RepID=UPI00161B8D6E|nr:hypothetical protein [Rhizobium lusitanum]QND44351.1 hypothetical protein HB780_00600 [Rhizobium lusitanum]